MCSAKLTQAISYLLFFVVLSLSFHLKAAEINCAQVVTAIESNICKNDNLLQLDKQLAATYTKLLMGKNLDKVTLQKTQKMWLLKRNTCPDLDCLIISYQDRLSELTSELRQANAYQPDGIDKKALQQLKQAVEQHLTTDHELALEKALSQFEIKTGMTTFTNVDSNDDLSIATAPTKRPQGVRIDEWNAFVKSGIDAGGENGHASYTLLDMNGDGKRDLILDSFIGGTGLFNYVSVMQRQADQFEGGYTCLQKPSCSEEVESDSLYSLNCRGSNQAARWVKLQGRVYVAYRSSHYGVDQLTLLRPLVNNYKMPSLIVHYEYTLTAPKQQQSDGKGPVELNEKTFAALNQSLLKVNKRMSEDFGQNSAKPLCPVPPNATEEEREGYFGFGPGHYSFEIVSNFPVWVEQTCYVAQLVNWFGAYDEKVGLRALLWMHVPNAQDGAIQEYQVAGKRKIISVEAGLASISE